MPDIALCNNNDCPRRTKCYRFMAVPNPYRQSYSTFPVDEDEIASGTCSFFSPIRPDDWVVTDLE